MPWLWVTVLPLPIYQWSWQLILDLLIHTALCSIPYHHSWLLEAKMETLQHCSYRIPTLFAPSHARMYYTLCLEHSSTLLPPDLPHASSHPPPQASPAWLLHPVKTSRVPSPNCRTMSAQAPLSLYTHILKSLF